MTHIADVSMRCLEIWCPAAGIKETDRSLVDTGEALAIIVEELVGASLNSDTSLASAFPVLAFVDDMMRIHTFAVSAECDVFEMPNGDTVPYFVCRAYEVKK